MHNSHTHVVYVYIPDAEQPIVMGFGKSDSQALADAKRLVDEMRNGLHDSLAIDNVLHAYFVRSNGHKVFACTIERSELS